MDVQDVTSETFSPIAHENLKIYDKSQMEIGEISDVHCNEESVSAPQTKSVCIFCGSFTKRSGKKQLKVIHTQKKSTIDNIFQAAQAFNDKDYRPSSTIETSYLITQHVFLHILLNSTANVRIMLMIVTGIIIEISIRKLLMQLETLSRRILLKRKKCFT